MINRTISLFSIAALLFCQSVAALEKNRFRFNMPLHTTGNHPIYQLEVPVSVYKHIRTGAFNDIRIFNAEGGVVPHQIRTPLSKKVTTKQLVSVAFFPVRVPAKANNNDLSVYIGRKYDGTIVNLNASAKAANETVNMYLVDASRLTQIASSLVIKWKPVRNTRVISVVLESSNNLKHWAHAGKATLAKLNYNGHSLIQNTIRISGYSKSRYYRIRWPDSPHGIAISRVRVSTLGKQVSIPPKRQTKQITTTIESPPDADPAYVYHACNLSGMYPIDQIQIDLPYNNSAINARIITVEDHSYRTRHRRKLIRNVRHNTLWSGTLYKLDIQGSRLQNQEIGIELDQHRKFYIAVPKDALPAATRSLKVVASWLPQKLLFVAQGKGPYTLAYGASNIDAPGSAFEKLEQMIKSTHKKQIEYAPATAGSAYEVADFKGKAVTSNTGDSRMVLWLVLISGVFVLAIMVVLIIRQNKSANQ